jgi:hypothetical protein
MNRLFVVGVVMSCLLTAGCGNLTVGGTVSLPVGYTVTSTVKCGDIGVAAFTRFLDAQDVITMTSATGDITTGHCEYQMTVPAGQSMQIGSQPYHTTDLHFTDCPTQSRTVFIGEQTVNFLLPFPATLNLKLEAPHPCQ